MIQGLTHASDDLRSEEQPNYESDDPRGRERDEDSREVLSLRCYEPNKVGLKVAETEERHSQAYERG